MKNIKKADAGVLEVGTPAPDFTAKSTHGEISLGKVRGKGPVVLACYPADFTPG